MKKIAILMAFFVFAGFQLLQAQTVQISGTVTSFEDGLSVPGVSVVVKGTTIGTVTDFDGKYTISAPANAQVLVFSFVGFKTQELAIGGRTTIDVVLDPDLLRIDELVVTALGIPRQRKALGYAVQEVTGDDISKSANPNLITALSGKVAGLEVRQSSGMPGAPATVFIRGARSFDGNNQPLYVVDGMPISSGADYGQNVTGAYSANRTIDIDPNDIESINILKGQAAAALYGLRASNGVILITTKSGKNAQAGKPVISFSTSYGQDLVARLPELQQTWSIGAWNAAVGRPVFSPVNSFAWGPKIVDLPNEAISYTSAGAVNVTYAGNLLGEPGKYFHPQKNAWVTPKAYNSAKDFFETGTSLNSYINVSHAGSMGNYAVGLGYTDQSGIVTNTGLQRYTGKMAGTMNLSPTIKVGFTGNIADTRMQKLPSGNDSWLFTVYGSPANYDLVGTPFNAPSGPYNTFRQTSYRGGAVGENPLWAVRNNYFKEATQRFFGNVFLEANPVSWINIRYQLGLDSYATDQENVLQMGSAGTGQAMPTATQYPTPTNQVYAYIAPSGGRINNYGLSRNNVNSLLNVTFSRDITDDLKGILILGNEFVNNYVRSWTMQGTTFTLPGWNNMSNTSTQVGDEAKNKFRSLGFYGNLSLEYLNMLFFNATGRQDIVSSMPRGNRTFFYPSASLGFVFTELGPLQNNSILPYGKVRASYAEVGQAGSFFDPTYGVGFGSWSGYITGLTFPISSVSGFGPSRTLYDPNLKPQNTRTYEFGLELKFLDNRIGVDYTYSDQLAKDQIFAVPLAGSTGSGSLVLNAGEMSTKTHEVMLYLTPLKFKDFEWNFNTNFTKIENLVVELADGVENIALGGYVTPNIRASAGDSYPAIYGNQYLRDDEGRILVSEAVGTPGYGLPLQGAFGKIGDVSPDFMMGFTNIFTYKFITLSAQIDWKSGGQMYSGTNRLMDLYGATKVTEDRESTFIWPGYKADGTPNDIVRGGSADRQVYEYLYATINSPLDEAHIYGTSFVKLRDVTLSVAIPRKLVSPIGLQAANLSVYARNILLWTELPNMDPETSQGMGNQVGGFDYMSLPQTMSVGVGLNLTF